MPQQVREGLVCAVVYLVARDFRRVAGLFSDLMLLPPSVLADPAEAAAFTGALEEAANAVVAATAAVGLVTVEEHMAVVIVVKVMEGGEKAMDC